MRSIRTSEDKSLNSLNRTGDFGHLEVFLLVIINILLHVRYDLGKRRLCYTFNPPIFPEIDKNCFEIAGMFSRKTRGKKKKNQTS